MTQFVRARLLRAALSLVMVAGLAGTLLSGMLAGPAYADNGYDHGRRGGEMHHRGPPPPPPPHGYGYRQPGMYYAAPPVMVAPPVYYQQPSPSLNFVFPLVIR